MGTLRVLWRDADRLPYLHTVKEAAQTYGTTIELMQAKSREFGELLLDNRVDVVAENYWNQQINRAKGWPLVSLACAVTSVNEQFVTKPDVRSVSDLHGKRIAIRDMRPTNLSDPLWVKQLGLDDAELVFVPEAESGRWSPWRRVVAGDCDAAIVTNLFLDPALEAGLSVLEVPRFGFLGNVVYTTTLEKRDALREDMVALVRAAFAAVKTFRNNAPAVLRLMEEIDQSLMQPPNITIASDAEKQRVYEQLRDELADPPVPTPEAIANFHAMAVPHYEELKSFNPLLMWDLSIARDVMDGRL